MRWKTSASVVTALAFLIPAAPAVAQTEPPGLDAACQAVERKVYQDIRKLVTIDLDTTTDVEVRLLANQILSAATANSLPVLPRAMQKHLDGTADELRAFLKTGVQQAWLTDLRVSALRTLMSAGANVKAAAKKVLDDGAIDAFLAYLNDGLYAARKSDCASRPTPTPSVKPSATKTVAPSPTSSASPNTPGGEGGDNSSGKDGGLPVTGADAGAVAGIGGALLLLGGAGYLIGRRRRSRFVA